VRSIVERLPRGALAAGIGAVALLLALFLPWISLPGGRIAIEVLTLRGEPLPATGSAWRSLPLLSMLLASLAVLGGAVTVASVFTWRRRIVVAALAAGYGLAVLAATVLRLFVDRVADDQTAVGAGGYLGIAAAALITLGALTVIRDLRTGRRPSSTRPTPARPPAAEPVHAPQRRLWLPAAAAIVAGYLATRLAFVDRFPFFFDEGIYADHARFATESRDDLFIALEIGQGPLFTWLSAVWVELGVPELTATRIVSVISGLLTIPVVWLLARTLSDAITGFVAAALCVVVPFFVVHDGIGIYEPLVTLIMASALLLQITLARRPNLRLAALLGLVLAAGLLTKQNTLPALFLLPVSLLCFDWSEHELRRRLSVWLAGVALVVVMVVAADLLQRTSPYWDDRERAINDILVWPVRSVDSVLDDPFALLGQNWEVYRAALVGYLTIPLVAAGAIGAGLAWRRDPRLTAVFLAWVAVPFFVGMLFQLRPAPRHAMFLLPPVLVLAAHALVTAARLAERRLPRRVAPAAVAVAAAALLTPAAVLDTRVLADPGAARYPGHDYWQYVAGWPAGEPWRETAALLKRRGQGPQVVVLVPGSYDLLRHNLGDARYVFARPGDPLAGRAQFAVHDTAGFPPDDEGFSQTTERRGFAEIARFSRPADSCTPPSGSACGGTVVVAQRR
jgi:4-amino-4-deoxy-L-arabinose transferase-like glycosyltransferase